MCAGRFFDYTGRYDRNFDAITRDEQMMLKKKSVCVIGCGGLGGGVIENLARTGVGRLTIADGDVFDRTNLNRQVFSNENNLGKPKAYETARQIREINSETEIIPHEIMLDSMNGEKLVAGHDVVVDALDNIPSRKVLEALCENAGIPLIHGAIAGWTGQVAVVRPGDRLMEKIYGNFEDSGEAGAEKTAGNPAFTPAVISGIQTAEALKILLNREETLAGRLLMIDLMEHRYEIIEF